MVRVSEVMVKGSIASMKVRATFPLIGQQVLALATIQAPALAGAMILESSVTAPVRANSRPSTAAPVVTVMEANARMFPLNTEPVPSVAELPTCQKTLAALAPPLRIPWAAEVGVRGEAIGKRNTPL